MSPPAKSSRSASASAKKTPAMFLKTRSGLSSSAPVLNKPVVNTTSTEISSESETASLDSMVTPMNKTKRPRASYSGDGAQGQDLVRKDISILKDMLTEQLKEMRSQRSTIVAEVCAVRKTCDNRADHAAEFEEEVRDNFERGKRMCDVVHRGIPIVMGSDESALRAIIFKLAAFIEVNVTNEHIVFVREISFKSSKKNRESILLVRFRDLAIRGSYMSAFFKLKKVTLRDLGHDIDERITISDNLTQRNADIRKKVVELKANNEIERFMVRDGIIIIILHGDRRRYSVKSLDELASIINNKPAHSLEGSMNQMSLVRSNPTSH